MRNFSKFLQRYFVLILALAIVHNAQAQRRGRGYRQLNTQLASSSLLSDSITAVGQSFSAHLDSIAAVFKARYESLSSGANNHDGETAHREGGMMANVSSSEEIGSFNPYYYPLIASKSLMREPLHRMLGILTPQDAECQSDSYSLLPQALTQISLMTAEMYVLRPDAVTTDLTGSESAVGGNIAESGPFVQLPGNQSADVAKNENVSTPPTAFVPKHEIDDGVDTFDMSDFHITIRRPNFWTFRGSFSTQFMQYYVSENWYKGGENHVSMLGMFNFEANYDNKRKITFTNKLETKLGFQTSPSDLHHHFKTNADLLRLTDKLGIQATKRWYYTVMLQSWTQFYKAFKANSETVSSDIMSPFESVLSVGMDYKLQKKRVNLTATLSPGAINMKYCDRAPLVTNYGIEAGKHSRFDFGSTVTINMTLKFCEQVNWVSRLYAFYDYKDHLKAEWENTINLKVNKYLSTKLFLYPRFDNNVTKKNPDDKYIQFNEYLSVGLDLNF